MAFSKPNYRLSVAGRLTREPEMRYTQSGTPVTNITVAIDQSYKDSNGQKVERTEFVRVSAWNQAAEVLNEWCVKGQFMMFEGTPSINQWTDKDGNARADLEIRMDSFVFGPKPLASDGSGQAPEPVEEIPF